MKTSNYQITLIGENKVEILAIVKSKGLANKVYGMFTEVYKNTDCSISIEETKKKLKSMSKTDYIMSGCQI